MDSDGSSEELETWFAMGGLCCRIWWRDGSLQRLSDRDLEFMLYPD